MSTSPLYATYAWKQLRLAQLAQHPLCAYCLADEIVTAATVCDHVTPHRGDAIKFWSGPFQSLCAPCHNSIKQREERGLPAKGVACDGWPLARLYTPGGGSDPSGLALLYRRA